MGFVKRSPKYAMWVKIPLKNRLGLFTNYWRINSQMMDCANKTIVRVRKVTRTIVREQFAFVRELIRDSESELGLLFFMICHCVIIGCFNRLKYRCTTRLVTPCMGIVYLLMIKVVTRADICGSLLTDMLAKPADTRKARSFLSTDVAPKTRFCEFVGVTT